MHPATIRADEAATPARVLVVDDSLVARTVLTRLVDASVRFRVAGAVNSVAAALRFLEGERVDAILLDVQMPRVDGLTALPDLLAASHGAKVLVVSSTAGDGAENTVRALALGAADTLEKPDASAMSARFGQALIERLDRLFERPAFRAPPRVTAPAAPVVSLPVASEQFDAVAVGASTGGIHALGRLLGALTPGFRPPILVTQHLPASFMPYFAAQLAVLAGRPCEVAVDRLRVRPGRLYVAPGDRHLRCVSLSGGKVAIRLAADAAVSGCLPSVDPMFASMADVYGPRMLAVVLSGMGRDGALGARKVREAGGCVVVQDQASSVVWGMPGAIASAGDAHAVLPPDEIGLLMMERRRA